MQPCALLGQCSPAPPLLALALAALVIFVTVYVQVLPDLLALLLVLGPQGFERCS